MTQAIEFLHANSDSETVDGQAVAEVQFVDDTGKTIDIGTSASGAKGDAGPAGASVTAANATVDADGKLTKLTFTLSDKSVIDATITTA